MNSWINLTALWQIIVVGLVCGAGLPALFAIGLRILSQPRAQTVAAGAAGGSAASADSDVIVAAGPVGVLAATACFAVVLAAIGWGIYLIVASS
jgi:hypothetical protein